MSRLITLHQPVKRHHTQPYKIEPVLVNVDALKTIEPVGKMSSQPGYEWDQVKSILNFCPGWSPVMETVDEIKLLIETSD